MKKKILVIDDEQGIRESLKIILENDYEIYELQNPENALENIKKINPDLVILDIKMPKMDGIDVLKRIKLKNPSLQVMILSGYKSVDTAQEAIRLGAVDYLTKPFDNKEVYESVKKVLS